MFWGSQSQCLPPRHKYDSELNWVPARSPKRVLTLSPTENNTLDKMFNNGHSSRTIFTTASPWVAPVFFAGKKECNLPPCFDYLQLPTITLKNKYPLPLKMELVDFLLKFYTYIKLVIRNTYMESERGKGWGGKTSVCMPSRTVFYSEKRIWTSRLTSILPGLSAKKLSWQGRKLHGSLPCIHNDVYKGRGRAQACSGGDVQHLEKAQLMAETRQMHMFKVWIWICAPNHLSQLHTDGPHQGEAICQIAGTHQGAS